MLRSHSRTLNVAEEEKMVPVLSELGLLVEAMTAMILTVGIWSALKNTDEQRQCTPKKYSVIFWLFGRLLGVPSLRVHATGQQ